MNNRKRLISNFLSLNSVQVANYIFPLITVPYLVRVLGPEKFGLIAFSQAFIQYFLLMTDYGFNLSATREIAVNREDYGRVSEVFSSVMLIKTAFAILSFLVLCLLVGSIDRFKGEWALYLLTFGTVIGNMLFPLWFFQGIEKMKHVAVLNIIPKAIFTISIFVFIKNQHDYILIPVINSLGFIVSGGLGFMIALKKFRVNFRIPHMDIIKRELKNGWHVFISTIATNFYTASSTFILGIFTNNMIVGYFSAGEKIVRAALGLLNPLTQTLFPHISKIASESGSAALAFLKKTVKTVGMATFALSAVLFAFAPQLSSIILGSQFEESVPVIRILSFLPFIIGLATVYANFFLLAFGHIKTWSNIMILSACLSIVGAVTFVYILDMGHTGMSISIVCTELTVLFLSFSAYNRLTGMSRGVLINHPTQ